MLDVVNPLLVPSVLLFETLVVIIEAFIIFFLLERRLGKAFVASLAANLTTGLLSFLYFLIPSEISSSYSDLGLVYVIPLIVNILVETGVLRYFYRGVSMNRILGVSAIMNVATYGLLLTVFS
ncbi:MAG: hypothetical protein NTX81_09210 [Candidatus Bathyarchaeota archaeon]|nr:hypothetical protein [Candidatus Bathyarchaeota archaeon]